MATIYRAHDDQLDRDVAVKLLRPEYGRDPDFGSRFRQEAQSAASLNHPNIVAVYDYGQDPAGPFIVMELVDGEDLASIVRRTGALPPRQAARIAAEAARALQAAHQRGIVHRDVKPSNILIDRDGRVKVADFGIARAVAEAQMTLPGTTLGSVHYFSPEQARGEPATPSSDIYSLGIVLFELLTGHRPWEADTRRRRRDGPAVGPAAGPHGAPRRAPGRSRGDRPQGARHRARRSLVRGLVDGRRARGVPRRHGRAGNGRGGGRRGRRRCLRDHERDRPGQPERDPVRAGRLRVRLAADGPAALPADRHRRRGPRHADGRLGRRRSRRWRSSRSPASSCSASCPAPAARSGRAQPGRRPELRRQDPRRGPGARPTSPA